MKPYGVKVEEYPDVVDIQAMAAKSSSGKLIERGGDYKNYIRRASVRARIRRYWKRLARAIGRKQCSGE